VADGRGNFDHLELKQFRGRRPTPLAQTVSIAMQPKILLAAMRNDAVVDPKPPSVPKAGSAIVTPERPALKATMIRT
jgi:hypothetical protein